MVTPLHIVEIDSASLNNKLFFAQHIVLSNRTHLTEMITLLPNTKAIHMAQLVQNKNSYVVSSV